MRRAWAAWLVAFAVLLQGLIPAAAIAADHPASPFAFSICTVHGIEPAQPVSQDKHHRFGGLACEQCVMASLAAVAADAPAVAPPTGAAFLVQRPARTASLVARSFPHRPPSRAPPVLV